MFSDRASQSLARQRAGHLRKAGVAQSVADRAPGEDIDQVEARRVVGLGEEGRLSRARVARLRVRLAVLGRQTSLGQLSSGNRGSDGRSRECLEPKVSDRAVHGGRSPDTDLSAVVRQEDEAAEGQRHGVGADDGDVGL